MADDKKKAQDKKNVESLGSGGARKAGDAIINRQKQIDDMLSQAGASAKSKLNWKGHA